MFEGQSGTDQVYSDQYLVLMVVKIILSTVSDLINIHGFIVNPGLGVTKTLTFTAELLTVYIVPYQKLTKS